MNKISIDVPKDRIIRRYMSFKNFEKLIKTRSMHFSRFDSFDDHLEGGINKKNYPSISNSPEILDLAMSNWPGVAAKSEGEPLENQELHSKVQEQTFPSLFGIQRRHDGDAYLKRISSWLYASCWTDLPHECDAMWQLYGSSGSNCRHDVGCTECAKTLGDSVCIETTVGSVLESLELNDEYNLSVRKIEYIDHRKSEFDVNDLIFRPFFSKALHFSYENEVRFMLWPNRKDIVFSYKHNQSTTNNISSVQLKIKSLDKFIHKIILSQLPLKDAKCIRTQHLEKYQSPLGLEEALSNTRLKNKVQILFGEADINIDIVESDLNKSCITDIYCWGT